MWKWTGSLGALINGWLGYQRAFSLQKEDSIRTSLEDEGRAGRRYPRIVGISLTVFRQNRTTLSSCPDPLADRRGRKSAQEDPESSARLLHDKGNRQQPTVFARGY